MPVAAPFKTLALTLTAFLTLCSAGSLANDLSSEALLYRPTDTLSGWRQQLNALQHYSGLECPDTIAGLHRAGVTPDIADTGPGCRYEGDFGEEVVFRQHRATQLIDMQRRFLSNYEESGFIRVKGPSDSITFKTDSMGDLKTLESLWALQGEEKGFTLWISTIENHRTESTRILKAFEELSARIERRQDDDFMFEPNG
ncbi:hypothetical protein [Pseudovibrio exalbescens]|uniref:hypothetical protein n=1 Tax=Pseudovibrio exalbescens TaxID=197461 RepID=UPI000C9C9833|nr:hypothetical protein [Pseudovibrio exalbescens]